MLMSLELESYVGKVESIKLKSLACLGIGHSMGAAVVEAVGGQDSIVEHDLHYRFAI